MVANVSYDLWLAASKGGSAAYEIMVWLGAYGGAGPISSTGSPVATTNIAGRNWQLFKGPNGSFTVFSFVVQGGPVTNFNAEAEGMKSDDIVKRLIDAVPAQQFEAMDAQTAKLLKDAPAA